MTFFNSSSSVVNIQSVQAKNCGTINAHRGDVNCVGFGSLKDNYLPQNLLASCSSDRTVRIHDADSLSELPYSPITTHTYNVTCCAFSPCNTMLATCGVDGVCAIHDIRSGKQKSVLWADNARTGLRNVTFSSDSRFVAACADSGTIAVWDVERGKVLRVWQAHEESATCCVFLQYTSLADTASASSCAGSSHYYLVSGSAAGDMRIWDLLDLSLDNCGARGDHSVNQKSVSQVFLELAAHDLGLNAIRRCSNLTMLSHCSASVNIDRLRASYLANARRHGFVPATSKLDRQGSIKVDGAADAKNGENGSVSLASQMAAGFFHCEILLTCGNDDVVRYWLLTIDRVRCVFDSAFVVRELRHPHAVLNCAISSDETMLATCSERNIRIWCLRTGKPLETIDGAHQLMVTCVAFGLNNCVLLSGGLDRVVNLWKLSIDYDETSKPAVTYLYNQSLPPVPVSNSPDYAPAKAAAVPSSNSSTLDQTNGDEPFPMRDYLECPITQERMRDPVVASDGYTYEREAIESWISRAGGKNVLSPMTSQPLTNLELRPNYVLRSLIRSQLQPDNNRSLQKN